MKNKIAASAESNALKYFTVAPIAASEKIDAEFCDFAGIQKLFGINRSKAYQLTHDGLIRSVSLRRAGQLRGKRLFDCASVRNYLATAPSDVDAEWSAQMRAKRRLATCRGKKK